MSEVSFYHVTKAGELLSVPTADAALAAATDGDYAWLHYCQTTPEELSRLAEPLGLHRLSIEDCFDQNEIPKMDNYASNTFVLFNYFDYANGELEIGEIDLFLGENFLVTVTQSDDAVRQVLDDLESNVGASMESVQQGPSFLMHVILDYTVDNKFTAIEALEDEMDTVEDAMLTNVARFKPEELIRFRRHLLSARKSLFHEREILVRISRGDCPFVAEKALIHYRDVHDHLVGFFEQTESYRDIITSLMEMYLSMLNNQMSRASNETNATVRRLTILTTVLMPLTLLAGIGGMSEWTMMTGPENWRIAYPAFILAMVVIGFINYRLITWLEKRSRRPDRGSLR